MTAALKTRLANRLAPSTQVVKTELLAGRTCPVCEYTLAGRAQALKTLISDAQAAVAHAGFHYMAGETLERDA